MDPSNPKKFFYQSENIFSINVSKSSQNWLKKWEKTWPELWPQHNFMNPNQNSLTRDPTRVRSHNPKPDPRAEKRTIPNKKGEGEKWKANLSSPILYDVILFAKFQKRPSKYQTKTKANAKQRSSKYWVKAKQRPSKIWAKAEQRLSKGQAKATLDSWEK